MTQRRRPPNREVRHVRKGVPPSPRRHTPGRRNCRLGDSRTRAASGTTRTTIASTTSTRKSAGRSRRARASSRTSTKVDAPSRRMLGQELRCDQVLREHEEHVTPTSATPHGRRPEVIHHTVVTAKPRSPSSPATPFPTPRRG